MSKKPTSKPRQKRATPANSTKAQHPPTPKVVSEEEKAFREALAKLEPRPQKFVRFYLQEPNATKAAIRAGYSEKTARQMGSENLSKPDIAEAIELGFQRIMGKNEVRARTAEVAAGSMEDFLSIERVQYLEPEFMEPEEAIDLINDTIADLSEELDSCNEDRADWIGKEIKRLRRQEKKCIRAIERAEEAEMEEAEGGSKRKGSRSGEVLVDLTWKERVVTRLDMEKAQQAGKLHLIKKLKETKFGIEIELHDAAEARMLLGKYYKLWGDRLALENADGPPIKFIVGVPEGAL